MRFHLCTKYILLYYFKGTGYTHLGYSENKFLLYSMLLKKMDSNMLNKKKNSSMNMFNKANYIRYKYYYLKNKEDNI